jgi:hypothetical protein
MARKLNDLRMEWIMNGMDYERNGLRMELTTNGMDYERNGLDYEWHGLRMYIGMYIVNK